jgi:two-component system response regulator CpxR
VTVLLVSDDAPFCTALGEFCATLAIAVEREPECHRGLTRALQDTADVVLLDASTSQLDSLELLHQIRRRSAVPVIIVTSADGPLTAISTALDAGADDVLEKRLSLAALAARLRAIVRRRQSKPLRRPLVAGDLWFSPATRAVSRDGRSIGVTATEYDILECLVRSAGRIVSRDELAQAVGRRPASPLERSIDVHISRIRRKLDDRGSRIRSVRGVGYVFCVEAADTAGMGRRDELRD